MVCTRTSCLRRLTILIYVVAIVASAVPVAGALREMRNIGGLMERAQVLHTQSRELHEMADNALSGAAAFAALLVDLPRLDRERVLHETDAAFQALGLAIETLSPAAQALVPPKTLVSLKAAIDDLLQIWAEVRRSPDAAFSTGGKASLFLHMFEQGRTVARAMDAAEREADVRIADRAEEAQRRVTGTVEMLLAFLVLCIAVSAVSASVNHRLLRNSEVFAAEIAAREADLRVQHDRFAAALAHMPHGIVMFDQDLRLEVCNDRYVEIYDLPAELRTPGTTLDALNTHRRTVIASVEGEAMETMVEDVHRSFAAGERVRRVATLANGRRIAITRERTQGGRWIAIHEDVTEMHAADVARARALAEAEALRRQEQAAEAASRAKSTLLATMSHEIRTPMNALVGLSGTLLESRLDADQRRAAEAIHDSSDNLLRLLNDILDYAKLESGSIRLEEAPFSPGALVDGAVSTMRHRAEAKGLRLRVDSDPELPRALRGDGGRLRQVLLNLLSNAIKFTAVGEILVEVRCLARDEGSARLRLAVTDHGIGIAPERIDRLFRDYVQADSSIARRFGGTGLGLAISGRIIRQMGGDIGVTSVLHKGSTFHVEVTLPVADIADLAGPGAAGANAQLRALIAALGRPLRLLLAEDNRTNQFVVRQMLKDFDIDLTVVEDGTDALLAVPKGGFDLVLMDVRMADMDGVEATVAIRTLRGDGRNVPIIALTANAFPEDVRQCLEAGMNGFLAKPVRKPALIEAMLRALAAAVPDVAAPPTQPELPAAPAEPPALDRAVYDELIAEIGVDGLRETLAVFLRDSERRLAELAGCGGEDRARIRSVAHALKGSAAAFGFTALAEAARALEQGADTRPADAYPAAVAALADLYAQVRAVLPAEALA